MADYRSQSKRNKARIDAIQAANLKRKYTTRQIKTIASAYEIASDKEQFGFSEESTIRAYLKEKGIDFGKKVNKWSYQVAIAKRIVNGEYGGLPQEAQPEQEAQEERQEERPRGRGLGGLAQLMLAL